MVDITRHAETKTVTRYELSIDDIEAILKKALNLEGHIFCQWGTGQLTELTIISTVTETAPVNDLDVEEGEGL